MRRAGRPARTLVERLRPVGRVVRERLREPRVRLGVAVVAVAALVAGALVAVTGGDGPQAPTPPGGGASAQAAERTSSDRVSAEVSALLEEMSTERKVAQLMLVGFEGTGSDDPTIAAFEDRDYAGLVFDARNYESAGQISSLGEDVVSTAEDADHVVPWLMAPQEGGEFNAFAGLPPDEAPSELRNPREAADAAREAAEALTDLGLTGILAPLLDVPPFGGGSVDARGYSDTAEDVVEYARATVEAYEDAGILSAAKYFPGLGAASQPTESGPATVGLTLGQLFERDLLPFREAIEAGVPAIVVGHGRYVTDDFVRPASTSAAVVSGLLREDLGFEGVAIADDVTSPAVTATTSAADAAVDAVIAGVDLVHVSQDADEQDRVYRALLAAVEEGTITRERLDEALRRNLEAKVEAGVLRVGEASERGGGPDGGDDASSEDGGARPRESDDEGAADGKGSSDGGPGGEEPAGGSEPPAGEGPAGGAGPQAGEGPTGEEPSEAETPGGLAGAKGEALD